MGSGINHQGADSEGLSVCLLGGLRVSRHGRPVALPGDARRVVVFLALERGWVPRAYVAGTLWSDVTQERAFGNLRSALWRVRTQDDGVILTDGDMVALHPDADVDVETAREVAAGLFSGASPSLCGHQWVDLFARELLPGWYDDFVVVERESLRQQAVHALEALADALRDERRFAAAMAAAMAAVRLDRFRESAHRSVMCIHIAEGNYSEARLQYEAYVDLLVEEFGLAPSPTINELVDTLPAAADAPASRNQAMRPTSAPNPPVRRRRRAGDTRPAN